MLRPHTPPYKRASVPDVPLVPLSRIGLAGQSTDLFIRRWRAVLNTAKYRMKVSANYNISRKETKNAQKRIRTCAFFAPSRWVLELKESMIVIA